MSVAALLSPLDLFSAPWGSMGDRGVVGADDGERLTHFFDVDATPIATSFPASAYPAFPSAFSSIETPASAYAQPQATEYLPWSYQARCCAPSPR